LAARTIGVSPSVALYHYFGCNILASDFAKTINCPVIHVNGDNAEDVLRACRLAMHYRNTFKKDVLVDLIGYVGFSTFVLEISSIVTESATYTRCFS
jgi:hypothetical protein